MLDHGNFMWKASIDQNSTPSNAIPLQIFATEIAQWSIKSFGWVGSREIGSEAKCVENSVIDH